MQPPQDPYRTGNTPQGNDAQWTQVPFPGQMNYANPGYPQPGQVPPPAQLRPEVTYQQAPEMYPPATAQAPYGQDTRQPVSPAYTPPRQETPQTAYQPPKTGLPAVKKQNNRGLYIGIAAAVILFAVIAVVRMVAPAQVNFAYVEAGSLSARYTGDAVVVRNETVYTQDGVSQIDYRVEEGSFVKRGDAVATVYSSGFSNKEWTTLNNYRTQIKEKQKLLMADAASDAKMLNLMSQVTERAMEVQRLVQGTPGSLVRQQELLNQAILDRQVHMRQKYSEDQKLTRLYDDENTQLQRISSWTKQYAVSTDGLVSFYTDGFESALNMTNYNTFLPAQVRKIYEGQVPQMENQLSRKAVSIYRVVRQEPWVVLMLCNEMEWTPVEGRTYKLLIESFDNTVVEATVESFTRSGGELLVRLLVYETSELPNVLYIRSCKVQLGESVNSLSVPSRAIYLREGKKGVVMTTQGGEYWTGVEVISDDGQTAYIIPENPGVLYEGIRVRLF